MAGRDPGRPTGCTLTSFPMWSPVKAGTPQFALADLAELPLGRVEHRIRQLSLLGLLA